MIYYDQLKADLLAHPEDSSKLKHKAFKEFCYRNCDRLRSELVFRRNTASLPQKLIKALDQEFKELFDQEIGFEEAIKHDKSYF